MAFLLISLSLLANLFRSSNSKIIARDYLSKGEDVFFFNAVGALSAALLLFLVKGFELTLDGRSVVLSVFFALIYFFAFYSYSQSLLYGSLSFTTLITSLGMIIPIIYGVFFLKEEASVSLLIALVLMIAAFVLTSLKGERSQTRISPKWVFWVFISFLSSGMIGLFQKVFVSSTVNADRLSFMCSTFFFLFVLSSIPLLFKGSKVVFSLKRVTSGSLQGVFDASQHTLNLVLASLVPSLILYPVLNGGAALLALVVSIVVFKEKVNKKEFCAIILLLVSILLISF